jgi:hypothetical protein
MKLKFLLLFILSCLLNISFSQTQTVNFNYTGSVQTWTVPQCVTSINVVVAGAKGGGATGGNGARLTATIPVTPGQVLNIYVGGQGSCGNNSGGWNGGGTGHASNPANVNYNSCGGGGATDIRIGGNALVNRVIVAGGGGGKSGGSSPVAGGAANCQNGAPGVSTYGAGGGGGTQAAGGAGGAPWAGTPPGGQAGTLGQGGNGGFWSTASGGGGGGGYYGGGGGGNDGCCTGSNGGGGGGAGSSLLPAGGTCLPSNNTGNGYASITYTPVNLVINPTSTNVTCFGLCNGTANANYPGATYLWSNGATTQSISNLCPGNYTVTVNLNGCTATGSVTITQPPQIVLGPISHN